jgi:thioredoxin reductase (NADPH)
MALETPTEAQSGEPLYDVVVVGGGPAGLTAAQYTARARLRTVVLDRSPTAGALARHSRIENYPGLSRAVSGPELLDLLRAQAVGFGAEYVLATALGTSLASETKEVYTTSGTYRGRTVIVATGAMGWKPTLKGAVELLGKGVSYCATCDAAFFADEEVAVLGETGEACEEALHAARFAKKVHFLAPRDQLSAPAPVCQQLAAHPRVEMRFGVTAEEILGEGSVDALRIRAGGAIEVLPTRGIFLYLQGSLPITGFLDGDMELSEPGCVVTDAALHTSVPGVYAAGDVTCTRYRQVVTACAAGAVAALEAAKHVAGQPRRT